MVEADRPTKPGVVTGSGRMAAPSAPGSTPLLLQKRQPAVQEVQLVGQSAAAAYTKALYGAADTRDVVLTEVLTFNRLEHCCCDPSGGTPGGRAEVGGEGDGGGRGAGGGEGG